MFNRYCDRLDKKQPDSERGWLWVQPRIEPLNSFPMIPHQVETQFIASRPFPVSVSGLIPSLSAAPVPCWFRKCQNQAMVTQTVREYPHQLASQTQGLQDTPQSQIPSYHEPLINSFGICMKRVGDTPVNNYAWHYGSIAGWCATGPGTILSCSRRGCRSAIAAWYSVVVVVVNEAKKGFYLSFKIGVYPFPSWSNTALKLTRFPAGADLLLCFADRDLLEGSWKAAYIWVWSDWAL